MDPRITLITLGVADLPRAVRFYRDGLRWPTTYKEGATIAFFQTIGTRLALYPFDELLGDITGGRSNMSQPPEAAIPSDPREPTRAEALRDAHGAMGANSKPETRNPAAFGGMTLAHNVRTKAEVTEVLALAERAGAAIVKPAREASWGGFSGYFRDPDGYYWEVAWNPFNPLDAQGFMELAP